jgi:hypothetical protein
MDPGLFFYIYITIYCKYCLFSASIIYFTASKHLFPHHMFNPLLSANWWDWQPHCNLGQSILVILFAGSTLLLALKPRTRLSLAPLPKSARNNLRKWFLSPTGSIKPWFHNEGKLTVVLIIPSSWGFPAGPVRHQRFFLALLPERKMISARGVSHFQSIYFVIVLLIFFTLFCLHLVYQKYKKISSYFKLLLCLVYFLQLCRLRKWSSLSNKGVKRVFKKLGLEFMILMVKLNQKWLCACFWVAFTLVLFLVIDMPWML